MASRCKPRLVSMVIMQSRKPNSLTPHHPPSPGVRAITSSICTAAASAVDERRIHASMPILTGEPMNSTFSTPCAAGARYSRLGFAHDRGGAEASLVADQNFGLVRPVDDRFQLQIADVVELIFPAGLDIRSTVVRALHNGRIVGRELTDPAFELVCAQCILFGIVQPVFDLDVLEFSVVRHVCQIEQLLKSAEREILVIVCVDPNTCLSIERLQNRHPCLVFLGCNTEIHSNRIELCTIDRNAYSSRSCHFASPSFLLTLSFDFALPLAFYIQSVAFSLSASGVPASATLYSANRFPWRLLKSGCY